MKKSKGIGMGIAALVGVGVAIGTVLVIKKLKEDDYFVNKSRAKEATAYLKDKYGEEAMAGKRVEIVNTDRHVSKTDIAQDVIKYNMQ